MAGTVPAGQPPTRSYPIHNSHFVVEPGWPPRARDNRRGRKAAKGDRDSEDGSEDGEEKDSDEVVDAKDAQDKDKLRALSCKRMPWRTWLESARSALAVASGL